MTTILKASVGAIAAVGFAVLSTPLMAAKVVSDETVSAQRAALAQATKDKGFGPQSPRDIDVLSGENNRRFQPAPGHKTMNLCNIHFHESAEHKGGEFTAYRGNGNGKGVGTGYVYAGELTDAEKAPYGKKIGETKYGDIAPGDTIEVHYVHTSAKVKPGPSLSSCLSEAISNPQFRVEAQVYVVVNDENALDFTKLAKVEQVNGYYQAPNIPVNTGFPVQYAGSTTGPGYNEKASPFQVSWSVRPKVAKISIQSLDKWLQENQFEEKGAHGVRNLVKNPALLSVIPSH